ncbi:M23 family metallopeptidase [Thermocoleostomius sinensis]|uniref:M23 family metallopeptidase n=1 Tax=Thermocoleostomius sinensis A174 TaxID=2016057 RepID=A0A9E8ZB36_9CYAN|nr:M23 family metallopeptidase [Thermocoleostomius sinensis]WAL58602.1 M23 family metallopeptidase [Thermocoleostomius sinensis A174]
MRRSLARAALISGGLGWFGSLSLLSANISLAQTVSPSLVPNAEELLGPDLQSSSPSQVPGVTDSSEPIEPTIIEPATITPIEPEASLHSPETDTFPPASAPSSFDAPPASSIDVLVAPNLAEEAAEAFDSGTPAIDHGTYGNGAYIDPTPYSLGATQKPDIVVSERSTGCQTVLAPGQSVPSTLCPVAPTTAGDSWITGGGSYNTSAPTVYNLEPKTASARDFYNLTVRPPARLSNNNVSLLFPLSIPAAITSAFGWRVHPVMNQMRFHSGTDLGAPQGTPVLAAFSGKVEIADFVGGYGLTVVLQHNKGTEQTLYAHLSELFVKPGEEVKQGEVIGRVGSTGLSTGPHLHFEFRKQTPEGWVVMDAGSVLEQALSQLVHSLQVAQVDPKLAVPAIFQYSGKSLLAIDTTKAEPQSPTANHRPTPPLAEQVN